MSGRIAMAGASVNQINSATKIDNVATLGLLGTRNSMAYRVHEIERHLHNNELWFGLAAVPSGETHRADELTSMPAPFQADAGNDTWGSWLQIIGSGDTPVAPGMVEYDLHELLIINHERNSSLYAMQIVRGESADIAAKLAVFDYTTVPFITPSAPGGQNEPLAFIDRRQGAGSKTWIRIWCRGANTATLDFYIGLHEYEG